ncbi:MAG: FAD-binding oxidoreductase, partial [Phycisphaerae bacterium]|nr:FAD-binding oxidoreductase [Gemmatimonadaceae bacterium]
MALRNFLGKRKGSTLQQLDDNQHPGVTAHKAKRWPRVQWATRRLTAVARPVMRHPATQRTLRIGKLVGRPILALLFFGAAVSVTSYCRTPSVAVGTMADSSVQVDEVTRLHPVTVARVITPRSVEEISAAVKGSPGPISIGGGRYSMGGQTATPDGLQLDMREFRGVVSIDTTERVVTVRSGTRWRELQQTLDTLGLAVKIMQTYNTFTVGGALSVNAHGRYIGQGPLIRSVREITLVLADGSVVSASPTQNPELFFGAVGGYGALGVIAHVTLDVAVNTRVKRDDSKMLLSNYLGYFRSSVRDDSNVVFHNADIYPPAYEKVHVVSYRNTTDSVTVPGRLLPQDQSSWTHRRAYSMISGGSMGKTIREFVLDPLLFRGEPVTWRNYEASYDVSELEPSSRDFETFVLQEYFVPVDSLMPFVVRMREVLQRHNVNMVNVSIRHALPDHGSNLAWAPTEVFAFVLYYKQRTDPDSRREVARWTRELIDAAIVSGGRYYLPYQPVATRDQFARAYPNARQLFETKRKVDSTGKFTNALWDLYQPSVEGSAPSVSARRLPANLPAEVRMVLDTVPNYARSEGAGFLTHPEWDLVYGSEAYASWLEAGKRPSSFPYIGSVGTFWRAYRDTWQHAKGRYSIATGTHVMLNVIGMSTAVEYGIKGVYEGTVGRFFELFMPEGGTAEDRHAAVVAREYAKLITTRGWYEYSFTHALGRLWSDVPMTGPGFLRKWERRFALSAEYLVKSLYATVIGAGTAAGYTPDQLTRYAVVAGWNDTLGAIAHDGSNANDSSNSDTASYSQFSKVVTLDRGYTLISVNRYDPYRDALLALSDHANEVRLAEISGADFVTV